MNKYIIIVDIMNNRYTFSALAESVTDELIDCIELRGNMLVESEVPIDYILLNEGFSNEESDGIIASVLSQFDPNNYYSYQIVPFNGSEEEFKKYELIYACI